AWAALWIEMPPRDALDLLADFWLKPVAERWCYVIRGVADQPIDLVSDRAVDASNARTRKHKPTRRVKFLSEDEILPLVLRAKDGDLLARESHHPCLPAALGTHRQRIRNHNHAGR